MTIDRINKPEVLEQEFMRASDIVNEYPIGKSTIWDWCKKGMLKPIKVSIRITVFKRKEVRALFSYSSDDYTETILKDKKIRRRKKKKVIAIEVPKIRKRPAVSDEKMIGTFLEKQNISNKMQSISKPIRQKLQKLPPAKEGVLGASKKLKKGRKNV